MTGFRYLTVADWRGRWARPPVAEKLLDGECAVHHVGGGAWMGGTVAKGEAASRAAACKVFYDLNEYAINTKGYSFLDYDILVWYDRFNDICWIAEGRGQWLSAATRDRNEIAEAIVLCGNTHVRAPLPAELEGLARGILLGVKKGWMSRSTVIYPHRDNPAHPRATQCCGQHLISELPTVKARVAALLAPAPEPEPEPTPAPSTVTKYTVVSGDTWYGIATRRLSVDLAALYRVNRVAAGAPLRPGDVLAVPGRSVKVAAGDGWYALARLAGCTLDGLLAANKATTSTELHPGQIVAVPTKAPPPPDTTLWPTPPGTPALRIGTRNETTIQPGIADDGTVHWLQAIIGHWPTTGVYDAWDAAKVSEHQEIGGIFVDGVYGEQTERLYKTWRGR